MTYLQKSQTSELRLRIRCQELNRICYKDALNAVLVLRTEKFGKEGEPVFTSQIVKDSFNPVFPEVVHLVHSFEENHRYIFQIYNHGHDKNPVGEARITVKEMLAAPGGELTRELTTGFKLGGKITVQADLAERNNDFIYLKLRGEQLLSRSWWGWFGSQLLFLRINRIWEKHSESLYVSESIADNKTIQWQEFYIQYNETFQTVEKSRLEVVLCYQKAMSEEFVARAEIEWKDLGKISSFEFFDREQHRYGKISILNHRVEIEHAFHEFLSAGLELNLTIGLDVSASIDPPTHHHSPHYVGKGSSLYEKALLSISELILDYSSDRCASVFSIGAKAKHPKIYTGEKVLHCFPINGDYQNPAIERERLSEHYRNILKYLQFSGPTDTTEIIRKTINTCLERKRKGNEFHVLVILSDGKLTNINKVKEILDECATLPIYIVFLAVGNDSKHLHQLKEVKMEVLTGDSCLVQRHNLINVGHYCHKNDRLDEIVGQLFKNLPNVVSRYMSLRKKTPKTLSKTLKRTMKDSMINPQS